MPVQDKSALNLEVTSYMAIVVYNYEYVFACVFDSKYS